MSKFMSKMRQMEGAVRPGEYNPLLNCLGTPSPSVNWAFGIPGHGLPYGYAMILYGPPKSGKSIIANAMVGQLHKDDPEAIAVTFNTELRGEIQANEEQMKTWGIDTNRFQVFDRNQPELIFDFIEKDIAAACEAGEKIRLVIIDSVTRIQGRRSMNSDTVMQQQIGDHALTISTGLARIIPVIRKYKIALVLTDHIRSELNQLEQMRGKTVKMASAWATKHTAEIFAWVEPNQTKDGRTALDGSEMTDDSKTDFMDKAQRTGHKIRFRIDESSIGPNKRTAEFTLDYNKGIINTHEEIFTLGVNTGVIQKPSNVMYQYKDKSWRGLPNMLIGLKDDPELCNQILKDVYALDFITHK